MFLLYKNLDFPGSGKLGLLPVVSLEEFRKEKKGCNQQTKIKSLQKNGCPADQKKESKKVKS